jgi:hypothetical protein
MNSRRFTAGPSRASRLRGVMDGIELAREVKNAGHFFL